MTRNKVDFVQPRKTKNYKPLPQAYTVVADDWIDKLGEKAYCAWLKFHSWSLKSNYGNDPENDIIPLNLQSVLNKFKLKLNEFIQFILCPLWEYGLINLIKDYEDIKILVFDYPYNQFELSAAPLKKRGNFFVECKDIIDIITKEKGLSLKVQEWLEGNYENIIARADKIKKFDITIEMIERMYLISYEGITDDEFIETLDALLKFKAEEEIVDFEKTFREIFRLYVYIPKKKTEIKVSIPRPILDWFSQNQEKIKARSNSYNKNDFALEIVKSTYYLFMNAVSLNKFIHVLEILVEYEGVIKDFSSEFAKVYKQILEAGNIRDAREDGTLDLFRKQSETALENKKSKKTSNPYLRRREILLGLSNAGKEENMEDQADAPEIEGIDEDYQKILDMLNNR